MSLNEIVVEGTLRPDGTLELDQKPNLSPGRVTGRAAERIGPPSPKEDWWQYMHAGQRRAGSGRLAAS